MKGLQKYLFGGLIGAILGFLIAPKRAQRVREALFGRETRPALPPNLMKSLAPGLFTPEAMDTASPPMPPAVPSFAPEPPETPSPQPSPSAPPTQSTGAVCATVDEEPWPDEDQARITRTPETVTPPPALVSEEESVRLAEPATDLVFESLEAEPAVQDEAPVLPEPIETIFEETASTADEGPQAAPTPKAAMEADLRARIEETRRRIREEMERPFRIAAGQTDEQIEASLPEEEMPPVRPVPVREPEPEPIVSRVSEQPEATTSEAADRAEAGESRFDYDEMRRRIEETRQRLKSKAFDAMMSGETSLLARERDGSKHVGEAPKVSLDRDVDQTIESGLAEEDL